MWEVVSVTGCPADCRFIELRDNIFMCRVKKLPVVTVTKCLFYAPEDSICPKCGNPASGYCYVCGVHIR